MKRESEVPIKPFYIAQNSDAEGDIFVFGVGCLNMFQFGIRASSLEEADFLVTQPSVLGGLKTEIVERIASEPANYLGIYKL
jgi:hypothetical protein